MASTVDDLTIDYTEDDKLVIRQLDKEVLTKGAWSTVVYRFEEWNRTKEEYGPNKYSIRRYQKRNDEYRQKSKFNITNRGQAEKLIAILQKWLDENPE
ncbi:hypothetical protein MNBD_GAMMA22-2689 [hydrothermal vent metagenome]|uniref:Uncharacterized protein n=1 Tax=hydrothermal vent metagenome TaxID=652676 RepID=A0A3B0ZCY0_9ZZZZ